MFSFCHEFHWCAFSILCDSYLLVVYCQIFGARVRVDAVSKVAELELAEKEKMKAKVEKILKHNMNVFINR